ncbi:MULTISPECIES: DedA family protein [unclassified Siphonobacter]|uniref:DedA family protein n=1 Tax=unclassified Siphonobacter TaxID=2635712 RepID=UPI000CBED2F9|nr:MULTISPECIES: DedA family protein [unclassified Siphonobacter]MDQ1086012.1 membrane-associated protein [Siphonobacter sp. SORGH_AS_1065]MDR6196336.1 membrane-associated protein [Siphonobacter sp. SORGH_AS_0500]PKK38054.1 cytochrome O ubiquinol oxidase [Siphonobacter sp. SORGH_AS_0500]
MELIKGLLDFLLHLDRYLDVWIQEYGLLVYGILFLIVFVETGLIVMPLLPGDSLLFAAGALAARDTNDLSVWVIIPLLILAALLGDNVNYFIGKYFSGIIRSRERILFFKREYLYKTEEYYAKYGGQTVIIARFVPIVRTIAPFVAGAGSMTYARYIFFCISGAVLWVTSISLLGYFFGNLEFVKKNFEIVVFGIIGLSVLPILWGIVKEKFLTKKAA